MSWHNWAGDQVCQPASVPRPGSVSELAEVVAGASSAKVRGSGHSFSEAALTEGVMIDLGAMDRVLDVDPASGLVRVEGGIPLRRLNLVLNAHGLAMANLGDIDRQTISGAISTATHGTGERLPTSRPRSPGSSS